MLLGNAFFLAPGSTHPWNELREATASVLFDSDSKSHQHPPEDLVMPLHLADPVSVFSQYTLCMEIGQQRERLPSFV
jgi:hypothetical protein